MKFVFLLLDLVLCVIPIKTSVTDIVYLCCSLYHNQKFQTNVAFVLQLISCLNNQISVLIATIVMPIEP
jgi:hypothetical protein